MTPAEANDHTRTPESTNLSRPQDHVEQEGREVAGVFGGRGDRVDHRPERPQGRIRSVAAENTQSSRPDGTPLTELRRATPQPTSRAEAGTRRRPATRHNPRT